jgi:dipeptidyl-peptidase-4
MSLHFTSPKNMKTLISHTIRLCLLLTICVLQVRADTPEAGLQARRSWSFAEDGVAFSNEFSGARLNECERLGPREYRLTISPENAPINPSPWYAFKITSAQAQKIKLRFIVTAEGGILRPRLSKDGKTWTLLDNAAFAPTPKADQATVPERAVAMLDVGPDVLWVAAQEMIGLAELGAWMDAKTKLPFARESVIGESIERRPLRQITFAETEQPNYVFVISRQHPPEVTGTLALMQFIDTLTNDSDLARRYRKSFQTVVIPLMNPDGIEHGQWRHNRGSTDLNRDWKRFTQPETRAARDAMLKLGKAPDAKAFLFLDFHSTGKDVFYGQPDSAETFPPRFASRWLGALAGRFPDYQFAREDAHNVGVPTSKAWAYDTFGCAAITYELGYNTDRGLIRQVSTGAAEEMMKVLLEEAGKPKTDPAQLTLARIFTDKEFEEEKMEAFKWSKRGAHYFALEAPGESDAAKPSDDGGDVSETKAAKELVRRDVESGAKTVLAGAETLTPPGEKKPLSVAGFECSADESQVLLFTNTKKVWRKNTRGDYWLLDVATKRLRKLGGGAEPSTLMFAKFSPDGSRVAFVRKNNLCVQSLADMKITALTSDGSDTLINGTADWVNEEEMGLRDGFRWSPDGSRLLFWQFDTKDVKRFSMVNQTDGKYPTFATFPYPKAGEKNSATRLGVVSAGGGEVRWLSLPGDPREHYLPCAEWTPDGKAVLLQQFNRLQNTLRVMLADPATGEAKPVLTETDPAWVENKNTQLRWAGDAFVWLSERGGWRQAYRVTLDGDVKPITRGEFDVIEIAALDAKGGWLYHIASPDNPTQRYLYRVSLDGGEAQRLSPADQPGTHSYEFSEDSRFAIHTFSNVTSPPVVSLVSIPEQKAIRVLKAQAKLREKLAKLRLPKTEFLRVDIGDGVALDGWCITSADFDTAQKHPLLMHVYGEPAGQTVRDVWGGQRTLWHWMLAQQGYVVASVDTRGTPSPRGRDWRKTIYRQLGVINAREEAAAVRALLQRFSFLDPQRVGIWGWSGGGSSSLDAIFRHPDLYRTAIAVAPVADRALYNTIYEERYMGLPKDNPEGYRDGSPLTHAKNLRGDLLIVHGTGDDNVHYQGTEKLLNELITHNKRFSVMPYPNRDHSINTGKGTSRHLYELMTAYLREHLPIH